MTSPNPKGLKAYLVETLAVEPQEVDRWVKEGQLRLFAGTLDYLTYTTRNRSVEHKVADIKRELSPLLEQAEDKADTWWSKVQPWVKESKYFSPGEARHTYRLTRGTEVGKIPAEPLVSKSKSAKGSSPAGVKIIVASETPGELLQQQVDLAFELLQQLADYTDDLQKLRDAHNAALEELRVELREAQESHAADLQRLRDAHANTLRQLRDELRGAQESHAAELQARRESYAVDVAQQREAYAAELKRLKESHDSSLERWQREEERLYNRINTLVADKAALREESRLEIRKEMLLRVGDIIQRGYQTGKTAEARLNELLEILPYALRDGGAQPLGAVGEIAPYDPRLHHSPEKITIGGPVRLTAPGVVVIGGSFGDNIILKANVTRESEAT